MYPPCLAGWLLSLPLCRTRLGFNKETKKCWKEDEGRASEFGLLGKVERNYSLFLTPCSARYERHRWEHLGGSGRSQSLVLLGHLHSLLPVLCPWVPALLLSVPCASISTFPWAWAFSAPFPGWWMERGGANASPEGRTFHILFCCFCTKWQPVFFSWD